MIINREQIFINQNCTSKDDILKDIAKKSCELGITDNETETLEALINREKEMTTDLGIGIAIPHAKTDYVKKVSVLFYRTKEDVDWDNGSMLRTCVVFLTPASNLNNIHLKMLASISRRLVDDEFRNMLINSKSAEEIYLGLEEALIDLKIAN